MTLKLDRIDINILGELMKNGRISNVRLSEHVGLSASPCLQRIKRMEAAGIITGYGAFLDLSKVSQTVTVFTEFTLSDHRRELFSRFEQEMGRIPQVTECHVVSGGYDYLVRFTARGVAEYQEIVETLLERNLGISQYFSYIVIKSPIQRHALPLDDLV
ncbi:Lrp/AsnC family transcriptional regulator [Pseudooceanicola marinus]|uniref:Lrp/AsnC family transcriptional regulator n=1 Tax=Pseudooceanicola marinus TaxID=396013 RepID=UPI001CD270E0|nr:Lrp/AsnC family transcriptional regulator [Pseudooceanicola marinus]MCA1338276.1 Lrp/AsnC family transcriptional regulator [Pseudooceanicola marinus]